MTKKIEGIIPVMITPFTANGQIDYPGLGRLVEWYIDNGSDGLFAVCQSSEMQYLSLEERVELAAFVRQAAAGRVPVIASGHISESLDDQLAELTAIAVTGVDGMVLVTNRLDAKREGGTRFIDDLSWLLERLPKQIPLGLYECPAPYRRLLTDDELSAMWSTPTMHVGAIRLAILTGCRISEACGAEWNQIDLKRKRWTLPATATKQKPGTFIGDKLLSASPYFVSYAGSYGVNPTARQPRQARDQFCYDNVLLHCVGPTTAPNSRNL